MSADRQELVYAGAVLHDGGVTHAYYRIQKDGSLEERAQLFPESLGDFPPGAVCSFVVQANGAHVLKRDAKFVRILGDSTQVVEWTSRHNAVMASELAWAAKELPAAFKVLDPIRDAYSKLDEERQGVLIAQVIRYIVRGQK